MYKMRRFSVIPPLLICMSLSLAFLLVLNYNFSLNKKKMGLLLLLLSLSEGLLNGYVTLVFFIFAFEARKMIPYD